MSTIWLRVMAMPGLQLPGQVGRLIEFSDNEYHVADVMAMQLLQLPGQVGKLIGFSDIEYHVAESDGYARATITRSGR